jgi:hypothetical protein
MVYRRLRYGYSFRRIYLGEGQWTIVEPADYYLFGDFKWYLSGRGINYYAARSTKAEKGGTKIVYLHREIMNHPVGLLVDHKNSNTLDNRRTNLRLATKAENVHNSRKRANTSSRFIGVYCDKRCGRWTAQIVYQGKTISLGRFDSEIDAAHAYDEAAQKYRGEFARLNFPI